MAGQSGRRSIFGIVLVVASVTAIGTLFTYVLSSGHIATAENSSMITTANAGAQNNTKSDKSGQTGPSGLPLPRFVSLKRSKVNVRRGPSSQHKLAWVFHFKGLPVEIVAEFENWRRVRDSDGQEGWIYHSLLAGTRTISVAPWRKGAAVSLLETPEKSGGVIANVNAGAIGNVGKCTGSWCEVKLGNYKGWIDQSMLWGVYPNEKL